MTPKQGAGELVAFKRRGLRRGWGYVKRLSRRGKQRVGTVFAEEKIRTSPIHKN
jgi:hypothetical protein